MKESSNRFEIDGESVGHGNDSNSWKQSRMYRKSSTDDIHSGSFSLSTYVEHNCKDVVFGSKLNVLFICAFAVPIAKKLEWGDGAIFLLALISIAPLAERLGYVTEQLAMHTNDTLGGLLNASFGNATELIITIFALLKARPSIPENRDPILYQRLVKVSLLGSVLSNLLLVFGSAILVGGMKYQEQRFNRQGAAVSSILLLLSCFALLGPIILGMSNKSTPESILKLSRFTCVLLVVLYGLFLYFQLKSHRNYYEAGEMDDPTEEESKTKLEHQASIMIENGESSTNNMDESLNNRKATTRKNSEVYISVPTNAIKNDDDEMVLSFSSALVWLAIISVLISFLSEYLVDAITGAAQVWELPEEFIGAILIPVVGNVAEHASAVVFAYRNKMDISLGVALGSATQIAVSVLPMSILFAWFLGIPLDLQFEPYEATSLLISVLLVSVVVRDGASHWLYGAILILTYMFIAGGFWAHQQ